MKTKSTASKAMPASVKVNGRSIKPMYRTNELTNRTNKNLWVTFVAGQPTNGLVFSMSLTRDEARSASSRMFGTTIQNIRSQRVSNYRKNYM